VTLAAAIDEWASARRTAGDVALSDAVRFYAANRADIVAIRSVAQVADEFVASRESSGVSDAYVRVARLNLKKFTDRVRGNITDITTVDINRFLSSLDSLGPVSRNSIRRNLITMFSFAKKQGYLHPDRKTAAELSEAFKEPDTKIEIFTPEEMRSLLLAAHDPCRQVRMAKPTPRLTRLRTCLESLPPLPRPTPLPGPTPRQTLPQSQRSLRAGVSGEIGCKDCDE
jgi:hypothetical protein